MAKDKWYSTGLRFSCTQCGNCCSGAPGYVWATKAEIREISEFLGRTDGWLSPDHVRRERLGYSLTEKPGGDCIFLERENGMTGCAIYPVRPHQCRTWPFWKETLRSPRSWSDAHTKCPGIDTGQHYDFVQIEAIRTGKATVS
jgi:Fe-S-cluster containining protein